MVCTLVCRLHPMRDHRTRTETVTYRNAAYHDAGNTLIFETHYYRSHMLLFRLCFDCFTSNRHSSFLKFYDMILYASFCIGFLALFFEKNGNDFETPLNLKFDIVEQQENMQLVVNFQMISHLMCVFILGVKDVTNKYIFTHS